MEIAESLIKYLAKSLKVPERNFIERRGMAGFANVTLEPGREISRKKLAETAAGFWKSQGYLPVYSMLDTKTLVLKNGSQPRIGINVSKPFDGKIYYISALGLA